MERRSTRSADGTTFAWRTSGVGLPPRKFVCFCSSSSNATQQDNIRQPGSENCRCNGQIHRLRLWPQQLALLTIAFCVASSNTQVVSILFLCTLLFNHSISQRLGKQRLSLRSLFKRVALIQIPTCFEQQLLGMVT